MAIRIDLHEKAGICLASAERGLEDYDRMILVAPEPMLDRELALRRVMTDLLWALQLTHEAVGG